MTASVFRDKAAIVGVGYSRGQTPVFNRNSGVSVLTLAVRAAVDACNDAGLDPKDLDGGLTYSVLNDSVGPDAVLPALGARNITWSTFISGGGENSSFSAVLAAEAVVHGVCNYVLVYRALNSRSGVRVGGQGRPPVGVGEPLTGARKWDTVYGFGGAAAIFGLGARRYMAKYGVSSEDFGRFAVNSRSHALNNPRAAMRSPIALEDHQNSRWICEPYHLLDCCQESDVGVAFVVTTAERAKHLRRPPVLISSGMTCRTRLDDEADTRGGLLAPYLLRSAGIELKDIDFVQPYDNFTDNPMRVMEDFGFCPKGEFKDFQLGGRLDFDGDLPILTQGGLMNEGYAHGLNNLTEAAMQLMGDSEDNCPRWQDGVHTYDRKICRQLKDPQIGLHLSVSGYGGVVLKRG